MHGFYSSICPLYRFKLLLFCLYTIFFFFCIFYCLCHLYHLPVPHNQLCLFAFITNHGFYIISLKSFPSM